MTTSLTIVDAEAAVRDWARAETHIAAQVGTKVFFSMPIAYPKAALATLTPWIVMTLVSETFQTGDLGMQLSLVQMDCYGPTKATASAVAVAVETASRLLSFGNPITVTIPAGTATIAWADPTLKRWFVDPTLNIPRYIVDVTFALHGPEA